MFNFITPQAASHAVLFCLLAACSCAEAQASRGPGSLASDPLAQAPAQWAADAVTNQLRDLHYDHYLRYRNHSVDAKGDQVRDVIESRDGTVARLILRDNRPLSAEEDAGERERLQSMLDSPEAFQKHTKNETNGKKTGSDIIRLIPAALNFSYTPGQPQRVRQNVGAAPSEVVLDFEPNPNWTPPSLASEVLTGVQGRVWIDPSTRHMTRLEARSFRSVNVGWGVFAHVYPGGHVELDEAPAGLPAGGRWLVTHFVEHVMVRALMVKTFKEDAEIRTLEAAPIAAMPYPQAIALLLATPLPAH